MRENKSCGKIIKTNDGFGIAVVDLQPMRKKPCLCIVEGNSYTKVASFNDWYSAEVFLNAVERIFGA